jgi:UDP-glucose 4-epimerase
VVVDNLCNSSLESLRRVEGIVGCNIPFFRVDVRDKKELTKVFEQYSFSGVIHFAGLKSNGESIDKPNEYYDSNVRGTSILVQVMKAFNCKTLIFSSSAVVYGNPLTTPIKESSLLTSDTPYGHSKLLIEESLQDLHVKDDSFKIAILRYFNPIGAHKSGLIGEDPNDVPSNLAPSISQVAIGKLEKLNVYGGDYNTPDGTGIRDYIHVIDLSKAHVKAFQALKNKQLFIINIGTGIGYSVLDMVKAFENVLRKKIPYQIIDRRPCDIEICFPAYYFFS